MYLIKLCTNCCLIYVNNFPFLYVSLPRRLPIKCEVFMSPVKLALSLITLQTRQLVGEMKSFEM